MSIPAKPDPLRNCAVCGKILTRKRFSGRLEDRGAFLLRKYCDAACLGQSKVVQHPTLSGLRQRYTKQGLRGAHCETCGATQDLELHHKDLNPANNAPENRMTLCGPCHTKWHWDHGKTMPMLRSTCRLCGKPEKGRGLCQKHLARQRRNGDPLLTRGVGQSRTNLVRVGPYD